MEMNAHIIINIKRAFSKMSINDFLKSRNIKNENYTQSRTSMFKDKYFLRPVAKNK